MPEKSWEESGDGVVMGGISINYMQNRRLNDVIKCIPLARLLARLLRLGIAPISRT